MSHCRLVTLHPVSGVLDGQQRSMTVTDTSTPVLGDFERTDADQKPTIGLGGLISIAVSVQIGSGWLLATLSAASHAGPASIIAWVVGAVFFAVVAIVWVELGTMLPRSGAGVRYPRLTHGPLTSWFNGWGYFLAAVALPVLELQAVLSYVSGTWPQLGITATRQGTTLLTWPTGILIGAALLVMFFFINVFGVKLLAEANKYITVWKIVIPIATACLMFFAFRADNFHAFGGFAPEGVSAIFGAVSGGGIVFAFNGIRQILDFGSEVKNPAKNIPIAMLVGGLLIPLTIYLFLQIAFIGVIRWDALGIPAGDWGGLLTSNWSSAPLLHGVMVAGFGWFTVLLLIDAVVSPGTTGLVWLGLAGRAAQGMSVNGDFPKILQRNNRYRVPWIALLVCTVLGFLMFAPLPSWYQLVGMVSTALMLPYLLAGPTLMVLRKYAPQLPRPVKLKNPLFWSIMAYVPSLALMYFAGWVTLVNLLTATFYSLPLYLALTSVKHGWSRRVPSMILAVVFGVVWTIIAWKGGWIASIDGKQAPGSWAFTPYFAAMVISIAVFIALLWVISTSEGRENIRGGLWLITTLILTLLLSYLGQFGPAKALPDQIDLILLVLVGLGTFFWAVRSGINTDSLRNIVGHTGVNAVIDPKLGRPVH